MRVVKSSSKGKNVFIAQSFIAVVDDPIVFYVNAIKMLTTIELFFNVIVREQINNRGRCYC